jgi:ABC-type multidrug transport system ATPase subunit
MSWSNVTVELIEREHSHFPFCTKTDSSTSRRALLNNIFGVVRPGEVLAVMGTSGAGE